MKKTMKFSTQHIAQIGLLGAMAGVLMLFEIPLPFAPPFYKIDLSEVPVLIGGFSMGPASAAMIELVKILLNFIMNGTETAGVGELANYLIGCSMCIPAAWIYQKIHSRKGAIIGLVTGTISMTIIGCAMNAYVLLPVYAKAFQMPIDALVELGAAVNAQVNSLATLVIFAVGPFNLLKGLVVSTIVLLIYKKISPILVAKKL